MKQCSAMIYVRDTYRYCGGRQQFRLHYRRQQCSRRATCGGLCWQHVVKRLVDRTWTGGG